MNLTQYQPLALRTEKPLSTAFKRLEHAVLGLITETGEHTTEVKRMAIYEKPLDEARNKHMREELGDVMWYLAIGADAIGYQLEDIKDLVGPFTGEASFKTIALLQARYVGRLSDIVLESDEDLPDSRVATYIGHLLHLVNDAATLLDTTLEQICADNIAKLQERFPDAYSNEAAEARADKGGADARNS